MLFSEKRAKFDMKQEPVNECHVSVSLEYDDLAYR